MYMAIPPGMCYNELIFLRKAGVRMKAERPYPQVRVTRKGERALAAGHPWVYAAEVTEADESIRDGGLADIVSGKGAYLGTGFYNSHSLIRCRLDRKSVV